MRPTGFSALPPVGPAIPVVDTHISDFVSSNNSYSAAYFESGLHCDVIIGASVVGFDLIDNNYIRFLYT